MSGLEWGLTLSTEFFFLHSSQEIQGWHHIAAPPYDSGTSWYHIAAPPYHNDTGNQASDPITDIAGAFSLLYRTYNANSVMCRNFSIFGQVMPQTHIIASNLSCLSGPVIV